MVRINLPTDTGVAASVISQPNYRGVEQAVSTQSNVVMNDLDRSFQETERSKQEARRDALIAADKAAYAGNVAAQAATKLEEISLDVTTRLLNLDIKEREEEENKVANLYALNSTLGFQEGLIKFKDELRGRIPVDGAGYTEEIQGYINNELNKYVNGAPNQKAGLAVFESLSQSKIRELSSGLEFERGAREAYRFQLADESANKIINSLQSNPSNLQVVMEGIDTVAANMLASGFNEMQVNEFTKSKEKQAYSTMFNSILNTDNPELSLRVLESYKLKEAFNPEEYNTMVNTAYNVISNNIKEKKKEAEKSIVLDSYLSGKLMSSHKDFSEVADKVAADLLFAPLGDTATMTADKIPEVASGVAGYFNKYNNGIGADTKANIGTKILASTNPYEVAAYSLAITSLSEGKGIQVYNSLDADAKTKAQMVSDLISYGIPAEQAVGRVNETLKSARVAGYDKQVEVLSDENIKGITRQVFGTWGNYLNPLASGISEFDSAKIEAEARLLFRTSYAELKDVGAAVARTKQDLKNRYALSYINGEPSVMEAAPEMYYSDELLEAFNEHFIEAKRDIRNQFGLNEDEVILKAIPNVTRSQPADRKQYFLYNRSTNMPIKVFTFELNKTKYGMELQKEVDDLRENSIQLRKEEAESLNQLSKWRGLVTQQ